MSGEYFNAIWNAGGIAVFLQWADPATNEGKQRIKEYAATFDGFLFGGGDDIDPKYYGEELTADNVEITPERDVFELALFREVFENTTKPIMGICRGCQVINVAMGGTLYQDISGHRQSTPANEVFHTLRVPKDSTLFEIFLSADPEFKGEIPTNSTHHQAIKVTAKGLRTVAVSDDGITEAVESADPEERFILAVQWHPEQLFGKDTRMLAIFKKMIRASL